MIQPAFEVAIIGAGFAGLAAAIRLKQENRNSFIIFERAAEVGGTWRDNVYPGCACDVPSHLYSYSFELNPNWSRAYSTQPEIFAYIKGCVTHYQLEKQIRYNTEITKLQFIESEGHWLLSSDDGYSTMARIVISATGPLNRPNLPNIKGLDSFKGTVFHSSNWNHKFDLTNKKVAVIGTGASAIQFIPQIAPKVVQLTIFQRSAPWVTPRMDRKLTNFEHSLYKAIPGVQRLIRAFIYWILELRGLSLLGNEAFNRFGAKMAKKHLENAIKDPILRDKLTPHYKMGCKRILVSDDYYPTFNRENVSLHTDGIREITPTSIIDEKGVEHEIDAIILGTGFVAAEMLLDTKMIGLNKRDLLAEWLEDGPEAYYGITVSGFPHLMFLVGPNTGLGHNSIIHMIESQVNYIIDFLKLLDKKEANAILDVKPAIQTEFNRKIQDELTGTVWASGCKSWYQTDKGKNTSIFPGLTVRYRRETKNVNPADYQQIKLTDMIKA